jgi:DNA-binding MarR family transcriptional regulator
VTQLYDEALRSQGLRGTQFTLLVVVRNRGPVTVKQLADTTVTDRTTLTRNLRPLEKKRLIRIESGKDRRERIVTLTDRGQRAVTNALPLWDRVQGRVSRDLGQERFRRLLADLSAVVAVTQRG